MDLAGYCGVSPVNKNSEIISNVDILAIHELECRCHRGSTVKTERALLAVMTIYEVLRSLWKARP